MFPHFLVGGNSTGVLLTGARVDELQEDLLGSKPPLFAEIGKGQLGVVRYSLFHPSDLVVGSVGETPPLLMAPQLAERKLQ